MTRRERRTFTKEFKQQIVELYGAGKPRAELIREYDLNPSSFDKWSSKGKQPAHFLKKTIEHQNRKN